MQHLRYAASKTTCPKAPKYHPSIFEGKNWRCCQNGVKTNGGCQKTYYTLQEEEKVASGADGPGAGPAKVSSNPVRASSAPNGNASVRSQQPTKSATQYKETTRSPSGATSPISSRSSAAPAMQPPKRASSAQQEGGCKVVAMYPYSPSQKGDLEVKQGDILDVLDDSEPNWWKARNAAGVVGFIPSNYVVKQGLQSEPWFHGKMGRSEAAALLRMAAFSGSFLVRESESKQGEYSLSVSFETTLKHYHIKLQDGQYYINGM